MQKKTTPPPPRAGSVRIHVDESWITKRFVIKLVLFAALVGPAIATLISPFVDQAIRNKVNEWMSTPDLFDSISIAPSDYAELPVHWRQTLSDIALRPNEEALDAQNIIADLTLEDIQLMDRIAPYMTNYGLLRDSSQLSEHPIPEMSYSEFSHLQDLGIVEDVNDGMRYNLSDDLQPGSRFSISGTTVLLQVTAGKNGIQGCARGYSIYSWWVADH